MKEYTAKKEYMILQGHVSTQVLLSLSRVGSTLQAIDPLIVVQAVHCSIDQKEQVPLVSGIQDITVGGAESRTIAACGKGRS